jgi:hypothetical protein
VTFHFLADDLGLVWEKGGMFGLYDWRDGGEPWADAAAARGAGELGDKLAKHAGFAEYLRTRTPQKGDAPGGGGPDT